MEHPIPVSYINIQGINKLCSVIKHPMPVLYINIQLMKVKLLVGMEF